jgi:hypothetical protein
MKKSNIKSLLEYMFREAPEASSDSVYGKYLFAPDRQDLKPKEKEEQNVEAEEELKTALSSWYGGGGAWGLEDQIDWIMDAIESGEYKKILAPPKNTKVYRWLCNLHVDTAANILQIDPQNISTIPTLIKAPGNLQGKYSEFQSWTTNVDKLISIVPNDLGDTTLAENSVAMIVESNTKLGKFLLNPKGIQHIRGLPSYAYTQDEIISYEDVHLTKAAFLYSEFTIPTANIIKDLINLIKK